MNNVMTVSTPNSWVLLDDNIRNKFSQDIAMLVNELVYNMLYNGNDDLDEVLIHIIENYSVNLNFPFNDNVVRNLIMFTSELLNIIAYADINILQKNIGITEVNNTYVMLVIKNV